VSEWFVRREFATAPEFLDALSPHSMWGERPDWWIYRGQGDSAWDLQPSAFRKLPQFDYGRGPYQPKPKHREQIEQEALLVRLFVSGINEQGGELPSEAAFGLTNWNEIDRIVEAAAAEDDRERNTIWPPPHLLPLFALGQHYGLPTRLLDWSERGRVAAYFAAEAVQRMREVGDVPSHIAVWAYSHVHEDAEDFWHGSPWHPQIVRVPRSRNANLHAQGGVFSVIVNPCLQPDSDAYVPPLNRLIEERQRGIAVRPRRVPLLYQLSVESRHAGELLRLLRYEQISSTYLFPGYEGVIRGITERRLWDHVTFPWDY
jgi:hypothetical protein